MDYYTFKVLMGSFLVGMLAFGKLCPAVAVAVGMAWLAS